MKNELSLNLVYYKRLRKMTNKTLSEATGVPEGTISRIASGFTKEPTLKTLRLLAKALNCTIDDLQAGDNVDNSNRKTAEIAQNIYDKPDLRILFDASKNLSSEDIRILIIIAKRLQAAKH